MSKGTVFALLTIVGIVIGVLADVKSFFTRDDTRDDSESPRAQNIDNSKDHNSGTIIDRSSQSVVNQLVINFPKFFDSQTSDGEPNHHDFLLRRQQGAAITIGGCPGRNCMIFGLKNLDVKNEIFVQTWLLSGEGFFTIVDGKKIPQVNILQSQNVDYSFMEDDITLEVRIDKSSSFIIDTPYSKIKLETLDTKPESLKMRLTRLPSTFVE